MSSAKKKTIIWSYQRLKTNIYKKLQNAIYVVRFYKNKMYISKLS
jgi:hypothetical protein